METIKARVWKFGDNVDTGQLAPAEYMKYGIEVYSQHCLENFRKEFAKEVKPGDIVVGGRNFGSGSSRETAVLALNHLKVGAVVADSFARIFFRNAVNLGLPVMESSGVEKISDGDEITIFILEGRIINHTRNEEYTGSVLPAHMMEIMKSGGLVPYLEKQVDTLD